MYNYPQIVDSSCPLFRKHSVFFTNRKIDMRIWILRVKNDKDRRKNEKAEDPKKGDDLIILILEN